MYVNYLLQGTDLCWQIRPPVTNSLRFVNDAFLVPLNSHCHDVQMYITVHFLCLQYLQKLRISLDILLLLRLQYLQTREDKAATRSRVFTYE